MILFNCKIAAQKYVFFDYQQTLSPVFDQNTKDLFEKSAFQPPSRTRSVEKLVLLHTNKVWFSPS